MRTFTRALDTLDAISTANRKFLIGLLDGANDLYRNFSAGLIKGAIIAAVLGGLMHPESELAKITAGTLASIILHGGIFAIPLAIFASGNESRIHSFARFTLCILAMGTFIWILDKTGHFFAPGFVEHALHSITEPGDSNPVLTPE